MAQDSSARIVRGMSENPALPDFWDTRYRAGRTPWELGDAPSPLKRWLAAHPGGGARVLIPGCGTGRELSAFAAAGYDVTAIDFSAAAVERARQQAGPALAPRILQQDFFGRGLPAHGFDLIYERTFLCALPVAVRGRLAHRCWELLRPGGLLVGLYYYGPQDDGPPFGLEAGEALRRFGPGFDLLMDEEVAAAESPELFAGAERWLEWRARPDWRAA